MYNTTEITSSEISSDNPIHQRLVKAYIEARQFVDGSVLEIGCGIGRGLQWFLDRCKKYTAIDKNKKLIQQLEQLYPQHLFIAMNIPPMSDIPDESFDTILSFQVIEHIHQDELFMSEIYRILKPGGKVILTTPNIRFSLTRNPWHVREYSAGKFEKLFSKFFEQVEMYGIQGNEKVMQYYERNKESVSKITKYDVLNLQYLLPRQLLQIPYDILNRFNRIQLQKQHDGLTTGITEKDYSLCQEPEKSLDLFYIGKK
ncbi:MAG TPA: SAM-dependent methyltransferase [Microscillaceae bacterium]|jgi:2-polyprenyl-3-methyl-5-hydroxy-6-metoxy-1,4-benzoquinol methylase|nr:SAM-dependent methyltransferase [Microscillaceae bacterium]